MDVIDEAKLAAAMKPLMDEFVAALDRITAEVNALRQDVAAIQGISLVRKDQAS